MFREDWPTCWTCWESMRIYLVVRPWNLFPYQLRWLCGSELNFPHDFIWIRLLCCRTKNPLSLKLVPEEIIEILMAKTKSNMGSRLGGTPSVTCLKSCYDVAQSFSMSNYPGRHWLTKCIRLERWHARKPIVHFAVPNWYNALRDCFNQCWVKACEAYVVDFFRHVEQKSFLSRFFHMAVVQSDFAGMCRKDVKIRISCMSPFVSTCFSICYLKMHCGALSPLGVWAVCASTDLAGRPAK